MRKPNSISSLIMFFPCMILLMSSCSILKKQDSKPQIQAAVPAQKKQKPETSKSEEKNIPEIKNYTAINYIE